MLRILVILLVTSLSSHSQNFDEDWNKIIHKIESENVVSMDVSIMVYEKENGTVVLKSKSSVLLDKQKGASLSKIDDEEVLSTKEYAITVNPDQKTVVYQVAQDLDENSVSQKTINELRKYLENNQTKGKYKVVKTLIQKNQGLKVYSLKGIPGFKEMKFTINLNDLKIVKIEYWYAPDENGNAYYCKLAYDSFEYNKSYDARILSAENYIIKDSSGKLTLAPKYKNYNLLRR